MPKMRKIAATAFLLVIASVCSVASSQSVVNGSDVRLISEASGIRDRNNGGNTVTGRLIGVNPAGVDNYMVFDFPDFSEVENRTVTGATVTFFVATGFNNSNHGSAGDLIILNEMALPNAGWFGGTNGITGSDNFTDDGSISFANRVEYVDGSFNGSAEPWLDEGGSPVTNLLGTLNELNGVFAWDRGAAPDSFSFDIEEDVAQSWVEEGLAGLVLSVIDDGNSISRFNLAPITGGTEAQIDFTVEPITQVACDFDGSLTCDIEDINSLVEAVVAGSDPAALDLTNDTIVDLGDITEWLSLAATQNGFAEPYLMGDATLDGTVDAEDLNQVGINWQESPNTWLGGDFNGSGAVNAEDLNFVGISWQQAIPMLAGTAETNAVPEPGSLPLCLLGFAFILDRIRR